jgi:transposase
VILFGSTFLEDSMCAQGLPIRNDLAPEALRRLARREPDRPALGRIFAIANALEGMSRAEAAWLAGMERQALRDAVTRYNAEGLTGLHNRPRPPRAGKLNAAQLGKLSEWILGGPDPEVDGLSPWTLQTCAGSLRSGLPSVCTPPVCRVWCGEWGSPGRRRASATAHPIRLRRRGSKRGLSATVDVAKQAYPASVAFMRKCLSNIWSIPGYNTRGRRAPGDAPERTFSSGLVHSSDDRVLARLGCPPAMTFQAESRFDSFRLAGCNIQ